MTKRGRQSQLPRIAAAALLAIRLHDAGYVDETRAAAIISGKSQGEWLAWRDDMRASSLDCARRLLCALSGPDCLPLYEERVGCGDEMRVLWCWLGREPEWILRKYGLEGRGE